MPFMNEPYKHNLFQPSTDNPEQLERYQSLEQSLQEIRSRYRHSEALLQQKNIFNHSNLNHNEDDTLLPLNDLPPTPTDAPEQDFRLPEIEMPPEREYVLDNLPDELFDNQADGQDALFMDKTTHAEPTKTQESQLAQLFKRHQSEREALPKHPPAPEIVPDPTLPETGNPAAKRAYLRYREREHNQRVVQGLIAENDINILLEEDWLAAQDALQTDAPPQKWVRLHADERHQPPQYYRADDETYESLSGSLNVYVYDLPELPSTRKIRVWSEQELLVELESRLRPHLTQALAGLVNQLLQRKLASLSYDLQLLLHEETPNLVEDVLEHNLASILREMKEQL